MAAARLLREQGLSEANVLIEKVMDLRQALEAEREASALTLAARAEACALKIGLERGEKTNIAWRSRSATTRRSSDRGGSTWRTSNSGLTTRASDRLALRAAMIYPSSDDIARRAADIQRANITPPNSRYNGTKAN